MAEQTNNTDMSDEPDRQDLEDRVDQLESTIEKMLPGRRDALKLGGAALVGGAAMSGSASAGTQEAGTIGTANDPVDVESEDINNADTITTNALDATEISGRLNGVSVFKQIAFTIQDDTAIDFDQLPDGGFDMVDSGLFIIEADTEPQSAIFGTVSRETPQPVVTDPFFNFTSSDLRGDGTNGPDGSFNIGQFFGTRTLENRSGSTVDVKLIGILV